MIRNAQLRTTWLTALVVGSAAMALVAPSAAWAGHRHGDHDRHRDHGHYRSHYAHYEHAPHARHHHASHRGHHYVSHKRHHHGSHKWHHKRGRRLGHLKHHVDYYCRACNHYFGARAELYDHVFYRHRVPYRDLEVAITFGEFGWIFLGI